MHFRTTARHAQVLGLSLLNAGALILLKPEAAIAQTCNVFGCSQPGAGECNPFGCPNPGASECTPFGCPASPTPAPQPTAQPTTVTPTTTTTTGGSPDAIVSCMQGLLYRTESVCTATDMWGRCTSTESVQVRSDISETTAAQACQNAR